MKFTLQIFLLFLIVSCKTIQPKHNLEFTIINKERISKFKNELAKVTKVNDLRKKHIDFIAYKDYSIGTIRLLNPQDPNNCTECLDKYSTYLVWKDNDIEYVQIFDNCGSFYPVKILDENISKFAKENIEILKTERVKYYQRDKNTVSLISHSRYKEFLISINNYEVYNFFDTYNLKSDSDKPNLNYSFNQSLKLITLSYMIEEEIMNQNKLNSFKRDLTQCK